MANDSRWLEIDGLRVLPICGGSDDTPSGDHPQPEPTPSPEPPAEPTPEPAPQAAPAPDPVATLRSDIADLRAELRRPAPAAPAPRQPTAEDIEAAYTSGRITLETRDQMIDDLKFQQRYERQRAQERVQDAESRAEAELNGLIARHPELGQQGSPLLREVEARLAILRSRGSDPTRMGTQLTAVEYVLEQRAARGTRPTPPPVPVTTGAASFAGGPPSGTPPRDEFADIPASVRDYWTRTGVPRAKWGDHAAAYRQGQERRQARVSAFLGRAG